MDVVVYIGDFQIVAPTYDLCNDTLHGILIVVRPLRKSGFNISWPKIVGTVKEIR